MNSNVWPLAITAGLAYMGFKWIDAKQCVGGSLLAMGIVVAFALGALVAVWIMNLTRIDDRVLREQAKSVALEKKALVEERKQFERARGQLDKTVAASANKLANQQIKTVRQAAAADVRSKVAQVRAAQKSTPSKKMVDLSSLMAGVKYSEDDL